MSNLPNLVLHAAREAVTITQDAPTPYDPARIRQENNNELPSERAAYRNQQRQFAQPVLKRRQLIDEKGQVLAEAVLISGGMFKPDIAVAINDKALKLSFENGEMKLSGRNNIKIVEIDSKDPERKTEVKDLMPKEALARIDGILLHTLGNDVVVAKGAPGQRIEPTTGSVNLTVEAKGMNEDGKIVVPRIALLDRQATYNITINNLPETITKDEKPKPNTLKGAFVNTAAGSAATIRDTGGNINIGTVIAKSADITFKYDNRKPSTVPVARNLEPVPETFAVKPGQRAVPEDFEASMNKGLEAARNGDFQSTQLPPKPKGEQVKER